MKKVFLVCAFLLAAGVAAAQSDGTVVRRIKVRHADPALIAMLLAGTTTLDTPPEMSTGFGITGLGGSFGGGFGSGNFGGGSGNFGGFGSGPPGGGSFGR